MTYMFLSKQGYGSMKELKELDTKEFFDLVEYEQIVNAINTYHARKK